MLIIACGRDGSDSSESDDDNLIQKVIFIRELSNGDEIFIMNPDGTGEKQLTYTDNENETDPFLSSDGTIVIFAREGDIYKMDPDGAGESKLTNTGDNDRPCVSPDGTKIAFTSTRDFSGTGSDIYVMDIDGNNSES